MLNDRSVFIDNDTLYIRFPAALPAYWLGAELRVTDGMFKASVNGVPFVPNVEPVYRIKTRRLQLDKQTYTAGDTLQGYLAIIFEERDKARDFLKDFYFRGYIYKIVRAKGYQSFEDDKAIMSYDIALAVNELGSPMYEEKFTTCCLPEFRVEPLNIFPASDSIYIRELTWNTGDDAQVSDAGIYRLTVWYAEKDSVWRSVRFLRWNTNMRF
ncbi:MAG: hypothetical protein LBG19_03280 [Prevotellaceae bacterium]|jgi:hypothetical protein|nr:hypothetical protein [Prevotellaceae bacterium]